MWYVRICTVCTVHVQNYCIYVVQCPAAWAACITTVPGLCWFYQKLVTTLLESLHNISKL